MCAAGQFRDSGGAARARAAARHTGENRENNAAGSEEVEAEREKERKREEENVRSAHQDRKKNALGRNIAACQQDAC